MWSVGLLVAAVGVLVTALLTWWLVEESRAAAAETLAEQGEALASSIVDALDAVVERLVSLGGLYQANEGDVTHEQFEVFVASYDAIPGMGGIGYMPIVQYEDLAEFEAEIAETFPGYFVFEFDDQGNRVPVQERSYHVPLGWFEPEDAFGRPHGFDSTSEPLRRSALVRARTEKEPAMTDFLTLVADDEADGFLVYLPVTDTVTHEVIGFAVAPMDLSDLLDAPVSAAADGLSWTVEILKDGRSPQPDAANDWSRVIDVGSIWWQITVTDEGRGGLGMTSWDTTAVVVALSGLVVSGLLGWVFYQYRRKTDTQRELDQLRALSRSKDQFLASVSHELRTPLTGVLGFAELLRDGPDDLSEADRRSMIANVAEEATDLAAIIDDLLVAARSELDLLAITRVPVSLRAQVAQVLENTDESIRSRIELIGDTRQTAIGDPGRVRQIVRNLVTNAYRYGGDRIEIRFGIVDGMVRLEVADDGAGLAREDWERIFEAYYRAHGGVETQPAAIGIGLSVARHLARLMDGDLTYRREADWSVFRLTLPGAPVVTREEARMEPARV